MKDRFFSLLGTCGLALALATLLPPPAAYAWGSGSGGGGNPCTVVRACATDTLEGTAYVACGVGNDGACTGAPPNACGCQQLTGTNGGCPCHP